VQWIGYDERTIGKAPKHWRIATGAVSGVEASGFTPGADRDRFPGICQVPYFGPSWLTPTDYKDLRQMRTARYQNLARKQWIIQPRDPRCSKWPKQNEGHGDRFMSGQVAPARRFEIPPGKNLTVRARPRFECRRVSVIFSDFSRQKTRAVIRRQQPPVCEEKRFRRNVLKFGPRHTSADQDLAIQPGD